jgi:hypothetical protein
MVEGCPRVDVVNDRSAVVDFGSWDVVMAVGPKRAQCPSVERWHISLARG